MGLFIINPKELLHAPPVRPPSEETLTIGIGASGDMRFTSPHTYLSSIMSPTTIILGEPNCETICNRLSMKRILLFAVWSQGTSYDETLHIQNLKARNVPWA